MNLDEFRKAMESDATVENERLKRDLADVEKSYREMSEEYTARIQELNSDCRALANRCFALTQGAMCVFCELSDYRCKHAMSIDDKVKAAKKLMEEPAMLKLEKTEVVGWEAAIRGMRNPMNSWEQSDSGHCHKDLARDCVTCVHRDTGYSACTAGHFDVGPKDYDLMTRLRAAGTDHRKFMRMIEVYVDITAPLYWWKEYDTYKVGTVANSCSTMHKIAAKEFTLEDFSHEHLQEDSVAVLESVIHTMNVHREWYNNKALDDPKIDWWQMIQLLPSSYNQKRTIMLNYEVLANIYKSRRNHKLDEWHTFCDWIESLPYSELITGGADYLNKKLRIPASDEIVADTLRKLNNTDAASPDKSKAILLAFYEKMKDALSDRVPY